MKKLLLAALIALFPSLTWAQCNGVFPANNVCGTTASAGIPGPLPISSFALGPGGVSGNVQTNNGAGGFNGITNTQLTALVNPFTTLLSGAVPASGGGTTNFLRADGSWTVPVAVLSFETLTGAVAASSADKRVWVSTAGNDANTGLSPQSAKLTLQACVNAANPNGTCYVGVGTYTLSSTLSMQPGVALICSRGVIITQGNAVNLTNLVDFAANSANGATINGCTMDQNRANNTLATSNNNVNIGTANNITILNSTIQNGTGMGVKITTGNNWVVRNNTFQANFYAGIYTFSGTPQTIENGQIFGNQFLTTGAHGIVLDATDFTQVHDNLIIGSIVTGLTVNLSGTTVTVTAGGTPFSNTCSATTICPGQFIIAGGSVFQEVFITSITSSTVATASTTTTTATGVAAIGGSGDLFDLARTNSNLVSNNTLRNGAGGGIILSNQGDSSDFGQSVLNKFSNNLVEAIGGPCYSVQQSGAGNPVEYHSFVGNKAVNCLFNAVAIYNVAGSNAAFTITGSSSLPTAISIDDQYTIDINGGLTPYWLSVSGGGFIFIGSNSRLGMVNPGIFGGISTIALGAGWGSTATTSSIVDNGNSLSFVITASGTGQASNATFTVTQPATGKNNPPMVQCKNITSSNAVIALLSENNSTQGSIVALSATAPVANATYTINCMVP